MIEVTVFLNMFSPVGRLQLNNKKKGLLVRERERERERKRERGREVDNKLIHA